MTMLSPHFSLRELTRSQTADRLGIDNTPTEEDIESLRSLAFHILEPVREQFGSYSPSSGYRCPDLERALTGDAWERRGLKCFEDYLAIKNHPRGEAADFEVMTTDNLTLARWIQTNLKFDQLILEFHEPGVPLSGWVHCSYREDGNRNDILTIIKGGGVRAGLG